MDTGAIIKSMLETPQFAGLQKEVVEMAGRNNEPPRKMLVLEQCGLTESQRGRIEMEMRTNKESYGFMPPTESMSLSYLYTNLACVSFGDVPTFLEFAAMRSEDSTIWMNAALRVNPVMFEWLSKVSEAIEQVDAELQKAEAEKKSETPPPSENG